MRFPPQIPMRALGLSLAFAAFVGLMIVTPAVRASHWCSETETFVAVSPIFPQSGVVQEFTISVQNLDYNHTQLTNVSVRFDWESTPRYGTGGPVNPRAYLNRTVTP